MPFIVRKFEPVRDDRPQMYPTPEEALAVADHDGALEPGTIFRVIEINDAGMEVDNLDLNPDAALAAMQKQLKNTVGDIHGAMKAIKGEVEKNPENVVGDPPDLKKIGSLADQVIVWVTGIKIR